MTAFLIVVCDLSYLWRWSAERHLALVLCFVIVSLRLCDQSACTNRPFLAPGHSNEFARAARPRVRPGPRPTKDCVTAFLAYLIHLHHHVGKRGHESLGHRHDRGAADGGRTCVDRQGSVFGIERGQASWILTAPGSGIVGSEVRQLRLVHWCSPLGATIPAISHSHPRS